MARLLTPSRIRLLWSSLLSTLWFLPGILLIGGAALAVAMVELSARVDAEVLARWPRLFGASADSSRDMLATIAGSLITVAGVTFSITMVAVAQASAQYSPRILRTFMRDRASQVVLGGLAGIFTYCLVVLRTIRSESGVFIPSLAVLLGFILAAVGIALLIFFIHHIAVALQASSIIDRVAADTLAAVDRLFPADVGESGGEREPVEAADMAQRRWRVVPARRAGYVQNVDGDTLLDVARRHRTIVRMERGVGEFVLPGLPLASVAMDIGPGQPGPDTRDRGGDEHESDVGWKRLSRELADAFDLGNHRTVDQDAAFGVRQLVDIAVKALSPGINDPTTAMNAVDHLGVVLARAAVRADEPVYRRDDGALRVIARGPSFATLTEEGLGEVRRYADGHVSVLGRLMHVMESLTELTSDPGRRRVLARQLAALAESAERSIPSPDDRERLGARISALLQRLDATSAARPSHARRAHPPR